MAFLGKTTCVRAGGRPIVTEYFPVTHPFSGQIGELP